MPHIPPPTIETATHLKQARVGLEWISHRGLRARYTENTLGAFKDALAAGFLALETDLRINQDQQLVLAHDPSLSRLLPGNKQLVQDLSRQQTKQTKLPCGSSLLLFSDFAEEFSDLKWTLDIKVEQGLQTLSCLKRWLSIQPIQRQAQFWQQTRFLLWSKRQEAFLLSWRKEANTLAREPECWRAGLANLVGLNRLGGVRPGRIYAIPPRLGPIKLYNTPLIGRICASRGRVLAYLPHSTTDVIAAYRAGADEVLVDEIPAEGT